MNLVFRLKKLDCQQIEIFPVNMMKTKYSSLVIIAIIFSMATIAPVAKANTQ
jgi:hypothetical protein